MSELGFWSDYIDPCSGLPVSCLWHINLYFSTVLKHKECE
ncbi:hypothetical protein EON65_14285 [archaeon]|nr:MAG: hypothetical protein EON65_14285 [archaeon]